MKQFQIAYNNDKSFLKELNKIKQWCSANSHYSMVFRIYSEDMDLNNIQHVCDILDKNMPNAMYFGCSTHANILEGALAKAKITVSCTVFEYATTRVEVLHFPFTEENAKEVVDELKDYCDKNQWVSSVEMHATMLGMSVREFCNEMSVLRSDIQIFGGGAYSPEMDEGTTYVFCKGSGITDHGIVFLLLGGSDFYTYSTYISGWKPLTRKFIVTKAEGATLYELDGEPAFNVYQRYLNIKRSGDSLIANTLEFPLYMDYKGVYVLRCPLGLNDDDSFIMATETPEGSEVRIAYGDPKTILKSIRHDGQKIADFRPEAIQTFSCAARRAFWGDENVSDETVLVNGIAPTSGFYTSGEFLRINGEVRNFNITLVFAAMREGKPKDGEAVNIFDAQFENIESQRTPLISRFVAFIEATTAELEELNKKLALSSITDGFTGLLNRTEIEKRIHNALNGHASHGAANPSLIMLDIDDFKNVNDAYGHKEGDHVILTLCDVLRRVTQGVPSVQLGRWGGEEFMILLPDSGIDEAMRLAQKIGDEFASATYENAGPQTVSVGVIQAKDGEDADAIYRKVDRALYMAKTNGKNQVIKLD